MNKDHAAQLIRTTLEKPFDEDRYLHFMRELLNEIDVSKTFIHRGNYIPKSFRDFVSKFKRLGTYTDPDGHTTDVLIVYLKKETSLHYARTMQRNFIARHLKMRDEKDSALVAYASPDLEDWRFSLVRMEYQLAVDEKTGKVKPEEKLTPARRFSFLVGEHEPNHTAQQQLVSILENDRDNPTLEALEKAFDIESVTKRFFKDYKERFLELQEELERVREGDSRVGEEFTRRGLESANFAKKLLGQIVFLYFLQKKGWLGVERGQPWGSGPKNFLPALFANQKYENFFDEILEPLFYEALAVERPDHVLGRLNCKIPFLNGGLFEPTGGYDWQGTEILIDNAVFENIFATFDLYNFTVREDEPLEKEVAVDPEMLGKVFENLLEVRDRKSKGAFYTPRAIVHYMCQESLINYLDTALNLRPDPLAQKPPVQDDMFAASKPTQETMAVMKYDSIVPRADIETLIRKGELALQHEAAREAGASSYEAVIPASVRAHARELDEALADVKICDPAIGSGAFPVGMMHEIVRAREVLTAYLPSSFGMPRHAEQGAGGEGVRTTYNLKRHAIQHSLYGVDIDPAAVDIAKLRLWLSLVVDEEDYKNIKPLPNLDYKIVAGNSLLGVEKDIFNHHLFEELEALKPLYFEANNPAKKKALKEKIDTLIVQLTGDKAIFDFEIYFSEIFHSKGGFDVVIGNPPYVSHDKIKVKRYLKNNYTAYEPFADLYCYFLEKSIVVQNTTGTLCFITSNSYIKSEYGKPCRKFISRKNKIISIINIEDFQLFETAIVNSAILLSQRKIEIEQPDAWVTNSIFDGKLNFEDFVMSNRFRYPQKEFASEYWALFPRNLLDVKNKIEKAGRTLDDLGAKIRLGIATGANYAFVIDQEKRQQLIEMDAKNSEIIKPILRGRDIFQYRYEQPNLYILLTRNGIDVKQHYPTIYSHLDSFGEKFKNRGAQGQHWTNLRACSFYDDFKLDKIVWIELTDKGRFALSSEEVYLVNSAYFMLPPDGFSAKYLLSILNSKLIHFYLSLIAETSGMGTTRWIKNHVKKFPIPQPLTSEHIDALVTEILATKRANPSADVSALEAEIDQLVYDLYDLTPEEIAIVEGATNG